MYGQEIAVVHVENIELCVIVEHVICFLKAESRRLLSFMWKISRCLLLWHMWYLSWRSKVGDCSDRDR